MKKLRPFNLRKERKAFQLDFRQSKKELGKKGKINTSNSKKKKSSDRRPKQRLNKLSKAKDTKFKSIKKQFDDSEYKLKFKSRNSEKSQLNKKVKSKSSKIKPENPELIEPAPIYGKKHLDPSYLTNFNTRNDEHVIEELDTYHQSSKKRSNFIAPFIEYLDISEDKSSIALSDKLTPRNKGQTPSEKKNKLENLDPSYIKRALQLTPSKKLFQQRFEEYSQSDTVEKLVKQRSLIQDLLTNLKEEQTLRYECEKELLSVIQDVERKVGSLVRFLSKFTINFLGNEVTSC